MTLDRRRFFQLAAALAALGAAADRQLEPPEEVELHLVSVSASGFWGPR